MTISTKKGDLGMTDLKDRRVSKDDATIIALGDLDECASLIIHMQATHGLDKQVWKSIVLDLYQISGVLSGYVESYNLDQKIIEFEIFIASKQNNVQHFIFPFDQKDSAHLHYVRAVVRRAERSVVSLNGISPIQASIIVYLNRLSDFIFAQEL